MAGRADSFLNAQERVKLLKEVAGENTTTSSSATSSGSRSKRKTANNKKTVVAATKAAAPPDSGCHVCRLDNDHTNLLLCEGCDGEYHTYCLVPKLKAIPKGDWFCHVCKPKPQKPKGDDLEQLVLALPLAFTSRFGEICWAQGGVGYGWWPSCIYDPRLTTGAARQEARKNLGKKHLVYFFECPETPFAVLMDNKVMSWEEGMSEDLYLGRAAKNNGKVRFDFFKHALHVATLEDSKPVCERLAWNHAGTPNEGVEFLPSPVKQISDDKKDTKQNQKKRSREQGPLDRDDNGKERGSKKRRAVSNGSAAAASAAVAPVALPEDGPPKRAASNEGAALITANLKSIPEDEPGRESESSKANLTEVFAEARISTSAAAVNPIEPTETNQMVCRVIHTTQDQENNIGFLVLQSRTTATFADARIAMQEQGLPIPADYRFFVHQLGPVSVVQESLFGPLLAFLEASTPGAAVGDGTYANPVRVVVSNAP